MADKAAIYVGKKVLGKTVFKRKSSENTKLDMESDFYLKVNHTTGKIKKHRKDIDYYRSRGIPEHDAMILVSVKKCARRLDSGFTSKVGWSAVIGFIPEVGDAANTAASWFFVIRKAKKVSHGKDSKTNTREMYRRLAYETVIGFIPVLGNIVDVFYRCNTQNALALEKMLLERAENAVLESADFDRSHAESGDGYFDSEDRRPSPPPKYQKEKDVDPPKRIALGTSGLKTLGRLRNGSGHDGHPGLGGRQWNGQNAVRTGPRMPPRPPRPAHGEF